VHRVGVSHRALAIAAMLGAGLCVVGERDVSGLTAESRRRRDVPLIVDPPRQPRKEPVVPVSASSAANLAAAQSKRARRALRMK
jgi:hypothetical protein